MTEAPPSAGRIFISYRRAETAYAAGWLFDRLAEKYGRSRVFKDVDSVELGDDFVEVITTAVASCDVVLTLIGSRWLTIADEAGTRRLDDPDDFVRLEIEAALARPVRIIPILVDGATMPRAEELPASLAPLTRRQALELSPSRFTTDTDRLLRVLDNALAEMRTDQLDSGAADTPPVEARPELRRRLFARPRVLVGAGIAAALVAVLIGVLVFSSGNGNGTAAVFREDFSGEESGWQGGRYSNGAYRMSYETQRGTTGGSREGVPGSIESLFPVAPENVRIDVDARRLSKLNLQGAYGLTCRSGSGRGYAFTVWGDHVGIAKFGLPNPDDYSELGANDTSAVNANGRNHLRAVCRNQGEQGAHLEFWVNGQRVLTAIDPQNRVDGGTVGLQVATGDNGAIEAEFDNFAVERVSGGA